VDESLLQLGSSLALPLEHQLFLPNQFTNFDESFRILFLFELLRTCFFYHYILSRLDFETFVSLCTFFAQVFRSACWINIRSSIDFDDRKKTLRFRSSRLRIFFNIEGLTRIVTLEFKRRMLSNVFDHLAFANRGCFLFCLLEVRRIQLHLPIFFKLAS